MMISQILLSLFQLLNIGFVFADGGQQAFRLLLIREEFASQELRFTDTGFDFDQMEGSLSVSIFLHQTINLRLKKAIGNFMSKCDLSHVDILFIEGIVQFNTLKFVSSFFSLLDESISFSDVADLT